jgi:hypothetical protein
MKKLEIERLSLIVAKMLYSRVNDACSIDSGNELLVLFPVIKEHVESAKSIILIDNISHYIFSALTSLSGLDLGGSDNTSCKNVFKDMSDIVYDYFLGSDVFGDAVNKLHSELKDADSRDYNRHEFLGIVIRLVNTQKWKAVTLDYYPADSKEIGFLNPTIRGENGNS